MTATGGAFLAGPTAPEEVATPEDLPAEALLMAETMRRFVTDEVAPFADRLEQREEGHLKRLMRSAGAQGLLAAAIPAEFDGLGLSRLATAALCEAAATQPAFALAHNVHSGVATLPLVWFGDDSQKARWLPPLATGAAIGAFALSEPNAGSDAMAARCRARRVARGWRLDGVKTWITNAGIADLFTLFAKADGADGLTAFLVPRDAAGLTVGPEENKLGLRGASTCALFLDDVLVPDDSVLGEIGQGHRAALYPLNLGRLNIAAGAVGMAKEALRLAVRHATSRRQFGHPLAALGLVQAKLGEMTARLFAAESVVARVAGQLDAAGGGKDAGEEFAIECAIAKVYATEALAFTVDEALQIHGGYGFAEGYPIARLYRDSRVYRIFEGTNEINRLTIADQLLKRLARGRLRLPRATSADGLRAAATASLCALRESAEPGQEPLAAVADLCLATFVAESATQRAARRGDEIAGDAAALVRAEERLRALRSLQTLGRDAGAALLETRPAIVAARQRLAAAICEREGRF